MSPAHPPQQSDRALADQKRIDFLVKRDGLAAATQWVCRTMRIYRQAVLNPRHHASAQEYRRKFMQSYCSFKAWLRGGAAGRAPAAGLAFVATDSSRVRAASDE